MGYEEEENNPESGFGGSDSEDEEFMDDMPEDADLDLGLDEEDPDRDS